MQRHPPKLADQFLERFCKDRFLEEIQGDLYHLYQRDIRERGLLSANLNYWFQIFNFIRPYALKKSQNSNKLIMLKYNFLIAMRNLKKQRIYSAINISGLAIAASCCLMISIYILDELSYDKHFANHENIYRISSHIRFNGTDMNFAHSPAAMKEAFKSDIPEVEESGRFRRWSHILLQKGDRFVKHEDVAFADADILNIFKLDFVYGQAAGSLEAHNSLLISQSAAEKHFGFENPVGKMIKSSSDSLYRIDGVYADLPVNSHFHFDVLLSMEGLEHSKNKMWLSNNYLNYFLLNEQASVEDLNAKLPDIIRHYVEPKLEQMVQMDYDSLMKAGNLLEYWMIPVTDIHLHSNLEFELEANSSMQNVYLFAAIGMIILFLACFNFMNLSTAKSAHRAKEVGMRKVMGSKKSSLISQFLTESMVFSLIAFVIAIVIVYLSLPYFNAFTAKSISNPLFGEMLLWPYVIVACLGIGLLAGVYPAFVLSSFQPISVLKGALTSGRRSVAMRNVLVVLQFSITIIMIIGTAVVYKQLIYSQNKTLGYDRNNVIFLDNTHTFGQNIESFRNELLQDSEIKSVTSSFFFPTRDGRSDYTFNKAEDTGSQNAVNMQFWQVDDQYLPTMNMKLVAGRNFDSDMASDSMAIIINQTAVKKFNLGQPLGQGIKTIGAESDYKIIGVIEDFYFDSFKEEVKPLILRHGEGYFACAIRYETNDPQALVDRLQNIWQSRSSGHPFEYSFMDQEFDAKFKSDRKMGSILIFFSALAIIIACLGLFALSAFTAEQRKKEIGIRKVLGASITSIVQLLFSNFSKLLAVATLIAVPAGYYLMDRWLSDFAYRTNIGIWVGVIACLIVFIIAWLTVASQTLKAAYTNPAQNLQEE